MIGCSPGERRAGRHRVGLPPRQGAQGVLPAADMSQVFDNVKIQQRISTDNTQKAFKQLVFNILGFKDLLLT